MILPKNPVRRDGIFQPPAMEVEEKPVQVVPAEQPAQNPQDNVPMQLDEPESPRWGR